MSNNTIKPGFIPSLYAYLRQRNKEYKALYKDWLNGTRGGQYAPVTWPSGRCMLARLPAELLLMVFEHLYQADLFHLALTCRALANVTLHFLYIRDISDFDCLALRWACTFGIVSTLERALSYGAPANHVFDPHSQAKCSWAIGGHAARRDPSSAFPETPLSIAIVANEPEIVRLLLVHGVDANAPDTPVPTASEPAYRSLPEKLFPIIRAMAAPRFSPFQTFQPGNPQIVRHLLDAGADPNAYTKNWRHFGYGPFPGGCTPLLMAMQATVPVDTVKLLLERGADPRQVGACPGNTLTCFGAFYSRVWDRSPLGAALFCSAVDATFPLNVDKIRLLLKHGGVHELSYMHTNSGPSHAMPVLYRYWAHHQIADVLRLFVAHGADIASWATMAIPPTLSIFWWAEEVSRRRVEQREVEDALAKVREVVTILAEATLVEDCSGPVRKSSIIDAMVSSDIEEVPVSRKGQTALRYVCRPLEFEGAASLIPVFLRYGADMNSPDSRSRSALHHASMFGTGDRVRNLVEFLGGPSVSGLVIDALDARGWTPLHYACLFRLWTNPSGQVATARLLLENGADVRAVTDNGWTPLSLAVVSANEDLVDLLLDYGALERDLFLRYGSEAEPAMAPIGRVVFGTSLFRPARQELVTELATSRTCVATLLEYRLGIPVSVPPSAEHPMSSSAYTLPNAPLTSLPRFQIDVVEHPFGIAGGRFTDLSGLDFEEGIDDVLDNLDQRGLETWLATISDPESVRISWRGGPSNSPDNQFTEDLVPPVGTNHPAH